MGTKENAQAIRRQLKAINLSSRSVSVRSTPGSIQVTVKASVPISPIREIAYKYQRIHRCEATGEILGGGNDFVFVDYDLDMIHKLSEPLVGDIEAGRQEFGDKVLVVDMNVYNGEMFAGQSFSSEECAGMVMRELIENGEWSG